MTFAIISLLLFLFFLTLVFGVLFQYLFRKNDLLTLPLEGFLFLMAVFQAAATPLLVFHQAYQSALILFWVLTGAGMLLAAYLIITRKYSFPRPHFPQGKAAIVLTVTCLLLVLFQAGVSSIYQFADGDDLYYVGLANSSIHSPALYTVDPSTGDPRFPVISQYRFESWELMLGVLADSFQLPAAAVFHTVLPFFLIVLAYIAYSVFAREILPVSSVPAFIIFLSLFHLMGGYSHFSQGSFLLTRVWQGKSILLHVVLPWVLTLLIQFFRSDYAWKPVLMVMIALLAGMAFTPITVFLPTLVIFFFCLIRWILHHRDLGQILRMAFALIPLAGYAIGIKLGISGSVVFDNDRLAFDPLGQYQMFLGKGTWIYLLYIPVALYFIFQKDETRRLIFGYVPLAMLLLLWNPIAAPYAAKYLTSRSTFWRVFWLLPAGMGFAVLLADLTRRHKVWGIVLAAAFVIACIPQQFYLYRQLTPAENVYKISNEDLEIIHFLDTFPISEKYVLAPEALTVSIRQVSSQVRLFWSRQEYIQEFLDKGNKRGEYPKRYAIEAMFTHNQDITAEEAVLWIKDFDITLIVAPKGRPDVIAKLSSFKQVYETQHYVIFYNPDI